MKKISLLKSLALLGAVGLTSVCVVETVLLTKDKKSGETDTKFDISTLNNYIIDYQLNSDNPTPDELLQLIKNNGVKPLSSSGNVKLADINDLIVVEGSIVNKSFILASRNNSTAYEPDKNATIYFSTGETQQLSSIITTTPDLFLDKYVDETTTKANILINLKNQYPSLNINDLIVNNVTNLNDEVSNAQVSARTGSMLYAGAVNVTYYTSGAAVLTYAQTTLVSGNSNVLPTFTFKGTSVTPIYTCTTAVTPITFTAATGAFAYATGVKFNGGLYQVKSSYTDGVNIFVAYANVFAQPNDPRILRETVFLKTNGGNNYFTSFTIPGAATYNPQIVDISAIFDATHSYTASFKFSTMGTCMITECSGATGYMEYWFDTTNKKLWVRTRIYNESNNGISITFNSGQITYTTPTAAQPTGWISNAVVNPELTITGSLSPVTGVTFTELIVRQYGAVVEMCGVMKPTSTFGVWAKMADITGVSVPSGTTIRLGSCINIATGLPYIICASYQGFQNGGVVLPISNDIRFSLTYVI